MLMKLRLLKIFRAIRALKIKQKTISNSDQRICLSSKIPLLLGLKVGNICLRHWFGSVAASHFDWPSSRSVAYRSDKISSDAHYHASTTEM